MAMLSAAPDRTYPGTSSPPTLEAGPLASGGEQFVLLAATVSDRLVTLRYRIGAVLCDATVRIDAERDDRGSWDYPDVLTDLDTEAEEAWVGAQAMAAYRAECEASTCPRRRRETPPTVRAPRITNEDAAAALRARASGVGS